MTKKEIYAKYCINYQDGKIEAPEIGFINPLLVDGNTKLGKGVWTFSMLPTGKPFIVFINGNECTVYGSCPCHCNGCYATKGNYNFSSVKQSMGIKTYLARNYLAFVENAIMAQIEADNIQLLRIHASGDFFSVEYIEAWKRIVTHCTNCVFWTYTKNNQAENAFNGLSNINIVKSIISGVGFNFGHCDYIIRVYNALKAQGKAVYICRCGIDKNQHCTNCKGCSKNEFVLFVEHSTEYKAEKDTSFEALKAIIEAQEKQ